MSAIAEEAGLAALSGAWSVDRSVDPAGSFAGVATFLPRPDGALDYEERGEMRVGTGSFRAGRRYVFAPREHGFAVYFDGVPRRLFHEVDLHRDAAGALTGSATHLCGADTYCSTYWFETDRLEIEHRVSGPRKNYVMTTLYTRADDRQAAA